MTTKIVFWVVFFVAIFAIAYTATDLFVKHVMADFKVEETGHTSLEVKPNYGLQTENHYNPQKTVPAKSLETADEYTVRVLNVQEH